MQSFANKNFFGPRLNWGVPNFAWPREIVGWRSTGEIWDLQGIWIGLLMPQEAQKHGEWLINSLFLCTQWRQYI